MNSLQKIKRLFLLSSLLLSAILFLVFLSGEEKTTSDASHEVIQAPCIVDRETTIAVHTTGELLFKENCNSCHRIHEELVGPALSGITERRPKKWIYAFIQHPARLISKGDTMAVNVYNKYNKAEMMAFPALTHAEIDSILVYVESVKYIHYKNTILP